MVEAVARRDHVVEATWRDQVVEATGRDHVVEATGQDHVVEALLRDQVVEATIGVAVEAAGRTAVNMFSSPAPTRVGTVQRRRVVEVEILLWRELFCKAGSEEKRSN